MVERKTSGRNWSWARRKISALALEVSFEDRRSGLG